MSTITLSPPWFTFANKIKYTYGESPFVKVNDLIELPDGNYLLNIFVTNTLVAKALRQVLPESKEFGNISVFILVYNPAGEIEEIVNEAYTAETLAKVFCTALKGNPLFVGVVLLENGLPVEQRGITIVIKKDVVQFYNDDISDLCLNFNEVAAKVFADVTTAEYPVELTASFTTFDPKCPKQKLLYCGNKNKPYGHSCVC